MKKIIQQLFVFIILMFFVSCSNFHGRIEDRTLSPNDTVKTIFLVNISTSKKYSFTIKETAITDKGEKTFNDNFYELEPGQEVQLGYDFSYSSQEYKNEYRITSFDTLKEAIDFGKKIKIDQTDREADTIAKVLGLKQKSTYVNYKTNYYKNGQEITPFDYYAALSEDSKLIDSTRQGNIEIITHQCSVKSLSQIPLPRIKTNYVYEITGQVLSK